MRARSIIQVVFLLLLPALSFAQGPYDFEDCEDAGTSYCGPVGPRERTSAPFGPQVISRTTSPAAPISDTLPPTVSSITMPDPSCSSISDVNISVDITHTWYGDVNMSVEHISSGISVVLMDGTPDDSSDLGGLYTFDDEAASTLDDAAVAAPSSLDIIPSGSYIPDNPLSAFDGDTYEGSWTLTITDTVGADDGTLNSWSVIASYTGPPTYGDSDLTDTITFSNSGTITDVNVGLDITTTFVGDLTVTLDHSGTSATLLSGPSGGNDVLLTLDDEGIPFDGSNLTCACNMQTQLDPLSLFDGGDKSGDWNLTLSDSFPNTGNGCLNSWSLTVETPDPVLEISGTLPPTVDAVSVPDSYTLVDADVSVDINHTFIGDLTIDIASPAGTVVGLHDGSGGGDDDILLTFDDEGIPNGAPYNSGVHMQPSGPGTLSDFDLENSFGDWTLTITDSFFADDGLLNDWCMILTRGSFTSVNPLLSEHAPADYGIIADLDVALDITQPFIGDLAIDLTSPSGSVARLHDHQGSANQNIDLTYDDEGVPNGSQPYDSGVNMQPSGPGTLSDFDDEELHGSWQLSVATDIDPGLVNGWCLLANTDPVVSECYSGPILNESSDPGLAISDTLPPTVDTISLADGLISDFTVEMQITHTWIGDLEIDLESPFGTVVRLHDHGGGSADNIDLVYDDAGVPNGSQAYDSGVAMQPSGPGTLADFSATQTAGDWTLSITDTAGGDDGTLDHWALIHAGGALIDPFTLPNPFDIVVPITTNGLISDVNVAAQITHTFVGDLILDCTSPAGTNVVLKDPTTGSGEDNFLVVWDDAGVPAYSVPYDAGAHMQPNGPGVLADFNGENMNGDWTFTVEEDVDDGGIDGVVNQLCLEISNGGLPCTPPVAGFSASTTSGTAPLMVTFTNTSTGTAPLGYQWDFNDDGFVDSTATSPTFTYNTPGTYSVALTVTNACGTDTNTMIDLIQVDPACVPPTANFTPSVTSGTAPLMVTFTNTSTGTTPLTSSWDFNGDGLVDSNATSPTFTYVTPGTYTVVLSVSNACGSDAVTMTDLITVTPAAALFVRGDVDGNGTIIINDPILILNYLFSMGATPPCLDAADIDDNGALVINDPILLLNYQFSMGPPPAAPFPGCGSDPTPGDPLGCAGPYAGCP